METLLFSIGMDIGGTNVIVAVVDEQGNVKYAKERKTNHYDTDYFRNIEEMISETLTRTEHSIHGIGIGVPGTIDHRNGIVLRCPALKWKNVHLKDYIENRFQIETTVDNDVNTWTIAEKKIGAAKDADNFVMITIGTGIGAGLFLKNGLYHGSSFEAGEIGHFPIGLEAYGESSEGLDFGFFEKRASAKAASYHYFRLTKEVKECEEVFRLAKEGDHEAVFVTEKIYQYLGLGISNIICLLNPEKIILGGGMTKEGQHFIDKLKEKVDALIQIKTTFDLAQTGSYGGAIGSALLTFNKNI